MRSPTRAEFKAGAFNMLIEKLSDEDFDIRRHGRVETVNDHVPTSAKARG